MEINIPKDCGNAPRKNFLKDFHIALAKGDLSFLETHVAESILCEITGSTTIETKESYLQEVEHFAHWKVQNLTIEAIIKHGNDAAVQGKFTASDKTEFAFCDLYKFKGFKGFAIKSIKSFLIKVSK